MFDSRILATGNGTGLDASLRFVCLRPHRMLAPCCLSRRRPDMQTQRHDDWEMISPLGAQPPGREDADRGLSARSCGRCRMLSGVPSEQQSVNATSFAYAK